MTLPPSEPLSRRDLAATHSGLRDEARRVGLNAGALDDTFESFLGVLRRYAEVEVRLLGSVPLQFPTYMYEGRGGPAGDPVREGMELARRERTRLDLESGAIDDPIDLIESQGLKVVQIPFPTETTLLGAFLFDATTGPAILLDGAAPRREREYAAAHLYGHFLADYDPYRTWVCRFDVGDKASPEELRSRAFAAAFLVPPEDLTLYLAGSGLRPGDELPPGILDGLRIYFAASDRALLGTLLASGWLTADRVADLPVGEAPPEPRDEPSAAGPGLRLPARFVGMAVAAHRTGALTLAELARYLDVEEAAALALERSLTRGDERSDDARSPT